MMEIQGGNDLSFLPLVCQVSHPRGTAPVVISALRFGPDFLDIPKDMENP